MNCDESVCLKCSALYDACEVCQPGYQLSFGRCIYFECAAPNCEVCGSTEQECEKCFADYVVSNGVCLQRCSTFLCHEGQICKDKRCYDCPKNENNNRGQCNCGKTTPTCPRGSFCDSRQCLTCESVMPNCEVCEADMCLKQKEQCADLNCAECPHYVEKCEVCNENNMLVAGTCRQLCDGELCTTTQICVDYGSTKMCEACTRGMRNQRGNCVCARGLICAGTTICDSTTGECVGCTHSMPNCARCNDQGKCEKYFKECASPNCAECPNSAEKCEVCKQGYQQYNGECRQICTILPCAQNEICVDKECYPCMLNEQNDDGTCGCGYQGHCQAGNYCNALGFCSVCQNNCKICDDSHCLICQRSYALIEGKCIQHKSYQFDLSLSALIISAIAFLAALSYLIGHYIWKVRQLVKEYNEKNADYLMGSVDPGMVMS